VRYIKHIHKSPVTGMSHDCSWVYNMTEEEWENYKKEKIYGRTKNKRTSGKKTQAPNIISVALTWIDGRLLF